MRDFVIMTDSCCDLPAQMAEELELTVLPLSLLIGEDTYRNYLDGREIGFHEFYDRVRNGAMPTTSAVSVGAFEDAMRTVAQEGKDILCLNFVGVAYEQQPLTKMVALINGQEYDAYYDKNANTGWVGGVYFDVRVVPEPTTATLSLLALAGLCARRRRKD